MNRSLFKNASDGQRGAPLWKPFLGLGFLVLALALALPAFAQSSQTPQIDPELLRALETPPAASFPDSALLPEYLRNKPVPLTRQEQENLRLANEWAGRHAKPVLLGNGKLVWTYGLTRPTVIGAPMQVCDIELQPGEQVNEIMLGDSARWALDLANSGSASGLISHVLVKPMDVNLETTAVITTDRRVYHLRLVSRNGTHTPYVGFIYPEEQFRADAPLAFGDGIASSSGLAARSFRASSSGLGLNSGQSGLTDPADLNFAYTISGDKASWKPEQVYSDGNKTFIKLPDSVQDMPVLLAKNGREDVLVNYRVQGKTFMVDGVHEHYVLLHGAGNKQERVDIKVGS